MNAVTAITTIPVEVLDSAWTVADYLLEAGLTALGVGAAWIIRLRTVLRAVARPLLFDYLQLHINIRGVDPDQDTVVHADVVAKMVTDALAARIGGATGKILSNPIGRTIASSAVRSVIRDEVAGAHPAIRAAADLTAAANKIGVAASASGDHVAVGAGGKFDLDTGRFVPTANIRIEF